MMKLNVSWPLKTIKLLGYPLAIVDEWNRFFVFTISVIFFKQPGYNFYKWEMLKITGSQNIKEPVEQLMLAQILLDVPS